MWPSGTRMPTTLDEYLVEVGKVMCGSTWTAALLTLAMLSCGSAFLSSQTLSLDDAKKAAEANNRSILTADYSQEIL